MQPLTEIVLIIPALNEELAIGNVLQTVPENLVSEIVVVDNGSTDRTAEVARDLGATVLYEEEKGYGAACLKGIDYFKSRSPTPEIVVFMDADYSDLAEEMVLILKPILQDGMDMVIGSRALGQAEKRSMTIPQRFGNWLSVRLLRLLYGARFTDLGPFRAIRFEKLLSLDMEDRNYGWTVEMQLKAAKMGLQSTEVPVSYRKRIGKSKVSGTVRGTLLAGYKILWTIFRHT